MKKAISRRKTVPYEQRLPLLTSTNLNIPSSTVVSITSSGNWSRNWNGVPSIAGNSSYFQPYPFWYPPSYPCPQYNQPGFMPFADVTNYCPSQYHPISNFYPRPYADVGEPSYLDTTSSNTSYAVSSSSIISEPFILKLLNGRIKVCAGCKTPHLKSADNGLLPPFDICLCHKEQLSFINPRNGQECSKLGNAHYHITLDCIKKKHPTFSAVQIECPPDTRAFLTKAHHDLLREAFGYIVED